MCVVTKVTMEVTLTVRQIVHFTAKKKNSFNLNYTNSQSSTRHYIKQSHNNFLKMALNFPELSIHFLDCSFKLNINLSVHVILTRKKVTFNYNFLLPALVFSYNMVVRSRSLSVTESCYCTANCGMKNMCISCTE